MLWGISATLARLVFRDHHVPPLTVVELRLVISAILMGAWLWWRRPSAFRVERRDWGHFVALGLFGLAAVQGSYYYSISVLGVGLAILIQYLAPSLIVAFHLARGRHVARETIAAVLAALLGTGLLVRFVDQSAIHATPLQWAIGFSSALSFTFYILYSKERLARYSPETVLFYTFCVAGLFWSVITPPWTIAAAGYGGAMWGVFVIIALASALIPFAMFYAGLKHLHTTQAAIIATIEPVVAIVSAAVVLQEGLKPIQNLGALLVLGASVISSRESGNQPVADSRSD